MIKVGDWVVTTRDIEDNTGRQIYALQGTHAKVYRVEYKNNKVDIESYIIKTESGKILRVHHSEIAE